MRKLSILLIPLLLVALIVTAVGCGGDDEEATPTQTPVATTPGMTPTPGEGTPAPVYNGGSYTFKLAHTSAVTTTQSKMWVLWDETLRKYTNDKVKLEIFPASSLYGSFELWDAVSTGAVDIVSIGDFQPQMAGYLDFQIPYIPAFFGETIEEARAHDGRFWAHPDGGQKIFGEVEDAGVKIISFVTTGVLQLGMSKFEADSMYDLKGKKLPSVGGLTGLNTDYVGAQNSVIDPAEFNIAFQQGLVDMVITGPESVESQRLYEIAKNGFVISLLISHNFMAWNLDLWNSLEPELKDIITNKVIPEVKAWANATFPDAEYAALERLQEENGVKVTWESDVERREIRDALWPMAWDRHFLDDMDVELIKLADALRNEPYDQTELPFPTE